MASWLWVTITNYKADDASQKVTFALISLIILWFITLVCGKNKVIPSLPPGPRGLPLVGYLPFLGSNLHHTFTEPGKTYGPIFQIQLGTKMCIVVGSPSLVKEVVCDQDVTFANRDPSIVMRTFSFGASNITFSDYGSEWRKMRKILASEMVTNSNLDSTYFLRRQQVKKMIADIYGRVGEVVDIGELAFLAIMNSVTSMIWGQTLKGKQGVAINAEFKDVIAEFMEVLGLPNISDFLPLLARFDLQGIGRRAIRILGRLEAVLDSAINIHNDVENSGQKDFLGYLLQLSKHQNPATSLTLVQVKAILMEVVIGGMDTTVTTVEWGMALMLQHPKVMMKVQEELTDIVGLKSWVEESHLPKLEYLKAVVKETLRLHPALPLLVPHCASKSTSVGGYTIPKGAQVFLNVYAIQRDSRHWEAPLEFKPERFVKEGSLELWGTNVEYLPFGSGRRRCPGIPLAERTVMHVLGSLVHSFKWTLPNGVEQVDLSEKFGIVVKTSTPLLAVPLPRLSNLDLYSDTE